MEQELDSSLKNLRNQKKFLSNCKQLYQKPAYNNAGMRKTIKDTEKLISRIEDKRNEVNPYGILWDFCHIIELLGLSGDLKFETIHDWIDTCHFIKWYGAESVNPVKETSMNHPLSNRLKTHYNVWYDDDGNIIKKERLDD